MEGEWHTVPSSLQRPQNLVPQGIKVNRPQVPVSGNMQGDDAITDEAGSGAGALQLELLSLARTAEKASTSAELVLSFPVKYHSLHAWNTLKHKLSLEDAGLVDFLLQMYEDTNHETFCSVCQSPLTQFCSSCVAIGNASLEKPDIPPLPQAVACPCTCQNNINNRGKSSDGEIVVTFTDGDRADQEDDSQNWEGADNSQMLGDGDSDQTEILSGFPFGNGHIESDTGDSLLEIRQRHTVMCTWCDVSFASLGDMRRHLNTHATPAWQQEHFPALLKRKPGRKKMKFAQPQTQSPEKKQRDDSVKTATGNGQSALSSTGQDSQSAQVFTCLQCRTHYRRMSHFTKHLRRKHNMGSPYKCCECLEILNSQVELEFHLRTHSIDVSGTVVHKETGNTVMEYGIETPGKLRTYKCAVCALLFRKLGTLVTHVQRHPNEKAFICCKCECRFLTVGEYTGHCCGSGDFAPQHAPPFQWQGRTSQSQISLEHQSQVGYMSHASADLCEVLSKIRMPQDGQETSSGEGPGQTEQGQGAVEGQAQAEQDQCKVEDQDQTEEGHGEIAVNPQRPRRPEPQEKPDVTANVSMSEARDRKKRSQPLDADLPYKCQECVASYKYASGLLKHSQKHTGQNAFCCSEPLCLQSFNSRAKLYAHQERDHWANTPITCHVCGKVVKNVDFLYQHMTIHTGELPYCCNECGLSFKNYVSLYRHRRKHNKDLQYECNQCGVRYHSYGDYTRHMQTHSGIKPFLCPTCGASFYHLARLKDHIASKHEKHAYMCEHCGKSFALKASHKMHMKTHLMVKPFQCTQCSFSCIKRHLLKLHIDRVHLGLKPHKCTQCDATYATVSRLNIHIRASHTNERPYKCPVCGKSFAKSGVRQAHLRSHKTNPAFNPPRPNPPSAD